MSGSRRIRTDLALETTERFAEENTEIRGVEVHEEYDEEKDVRTTVVKIVTENGAKSMGRPQGTYITIDQMPYMLMGVILLHSRFLHHFPHHSSI